MNAGELRIGAAAVVITPPAGAPMAGYYSPRAADGVHDDLHAKAIVFEQDGARAAVVACDLVTLPRPIVLEARRLVEKAADLPGDRVMISATHTHTGPIIPSGSSHDPGLGGDSEAARQYAKGLPELIARSVHQAVEQLAPAALSAGCGHEESLAFNRRYFMTDGSVGWNPGKLNPKIVRPAGPIDPEVPVLYCETPDGKPLATYVNYAMHLDTTGGSRISADYPFTLATLLGRIKGPQMVTLFTIGTAGDINHIDVSKRESQSSPKEAERIGTILAGEVLKTYARLKPLSTGAPRVVSEVVQLALAPITPADVEQARKVAVKFGKDAPPFIERVKAFKVLDVEASAGKPLEVEVQVIALSDDLAIVSMPGEIFVELGQAIKKGSPFQRTIIAELANGAIGYIPTQRAYTEGNYEPVSARCASGSGEKLVETALRLLNGLKAGAGK